MAGTLAHTCADDAQPGSGSEEVLYRGAPAPQEAQEVLLTMGADQCSFRSELHEVTPAELTIFTASLSIRLVSESITEAHANLTELDIAVVPTLLIQRKGLTKISVRGARLDDLELHFKSPTDAAETIRVLSAAVADVIWSLFAPLQQCSQLAPSSGLHDGLPSACAHVIYVSPLWSTPLFALGFAEVRLCGFAAELCIYSSHDHAETLAVITLTRCSTLLHVIGGSSLAIKERSLHHLVFTCPCEAELWADLLRFVSAEFPFPPQPQAAPGHFEATLAERARKARAASRLNSDSAPPTTPLLARAAREERLDEEGADLASMPKAPTLCLGLEGFDIAQVLAEQQDLNDLPPPSDTCCVRACGEDATTVRAAGPGGTLPTATLLLW